VQFRGDALGIVLEASPSDQLDAIGGGASVERGRGQDGGRDVGDGGGEVEQGDITVQSVVVEGRHGGDVVDFDASLTTAREADTYRQVGGGETLDAFGGGHDGEL